MKRLIIVRHAKSDWSLPVVDDFNRPLSGRGVVDAAELGIWLNRQQCSVDKLISSSALRAWQTAEAIAHSLEFKLEKIHYDKRLYHASIEGIIEIIKEQSDNHKTLLLVGHNPGLDHLLINLSSDAVNLTGNNKLLLTATVAMLSPVDSWSNISANSCKLIFIRRPREQVSVAVN